MDEIGNLPAARALLPSHAGATQAFELVSLAALLDVMPIDTSAAETIWDPWNCPAHLLPALANALSVDLWEDGWPEVKKRSVIAASPELHDLKTSIEGYRRHLAIVDCSLVDYIVPPKGLIMAPPMSAEERAAWLRELPELRLYTGADILAQDGCGLYADVGFFDVHFCTADRGREMRARKARIYDPIAGTLTQVGAVDFDTIATGETAAEYERIAVPGAFDPSALYLNLAFLDVGFAVPVDPVAAPVYTWRTDTLGRQDAASPLDALPVGYGLADAAPERVPLRRLIGLGLYADLSFYDLSFVGAEEAALGFYDSYRLARFGQKSGTPLVDAGSFYDLDYIGWPTHTLHLLVDATGPADPVALYADIAFWDQAFATSTDSRRFDAALRAAYVASGPGSDHVTLSTETTRLLTLSDGIPLDGSFHFGKRVLREAA